MSNYAGWLIKIGDWVVPWEFMKFESYKVSPTREVVDEFKDYDGNRHVSYAYTQQVTVSFDTPEEAMLDDEDVEQIQKALAAARQTGYGNNINAYNIRYFDPKTNEYVTTKDFTLADIEYTVCGACEDNVFYKPITFKFEEVTPIEL